VFENSEAKTRRLGSIFFKQGSLLLFMLKAKYFVFIFLTRGRGYMEV